MNNSILFWRGNGYSIRISTGQGIVKIVFILKPVSILTPKYTYPQKIKYVCLDGITTFHMHKKLRSYSWFYTQSEARKRDISIQPDSRWWCWTFKAPPSNQNETCLWTYSFEMLGIWIALINYKKCFLPFKIKSLMAGSKYNHNIIDNHKHYEVRKQCYWFPYSVYHTEMVATYSRGIESMKKKKRSLSTQSNNSIRGKNFTQKKKKNLTNLPIYKGQTLCTTADEEIWFTW